jgi:hypothetical protein
MDIREICHIAGQLGIHPAGKEKADLIRAIQRAEGIDDCFGLAVVKECDETSCLWREDCIFESSAEKMIH